MPIPGKRFRFTGTNVERAPEKPGIYVLYDGEELIYIGRAMGSGVTIRSRLQDHKSGKEGLCTKGASHYKRALTPSPAAREKALLNEYKEAKGRLPRCNERIG